MTDYMDKKNIKIFVSYNHKDSDWVDKDGKYALIPWLKRQFEGENVIFWTDYALLNHIGEEFEKKIKKSIEESDIAILLISQDFTASTFILEKELLWIKEKYDKGQIKILPLLITSLANRGMRKTPWIFELQTIPNETTPLIEYVGNEWIKIRNSILDVLDDKIKDVRGEMSENDSLSQVNSEKLPSEKNDSQSITLKVRSNVACKMYIDDVLWGVIDTNIITRIFFRKGVFWLKFVSLENCEDKYECKYETLDWEGLLVIDLLSVQEKQISSIKVARKSYGVCLLDESGEMFIHNVIKKGELLPCNHSIGVFCTVEANQEKFHLAFYESDMDKEKIPIKMGVLIQDMDIPLPGGECLYHGSTFSLTLELDINHRLTLIIEEEKTNSYDEKKNLKLIINEP